MATTSFSFMNGSPIIVRGYRRVLTLPILLFVASTQRVRRLAVQILSLGDGCSARLTSRHMMGEWTVEAKLH
jgi:hypothetical protein